MVKFKSPYKNLDELCKAVAKGEVAPADIAKHSEAIKVANQKPLSVKESDKGCIVLSGFGRRFPASYYITEWERLYSSEAKKLVTDKIAEIRARGESPVEATDETDDATAIAAAAA